MCIIAMNQMGLVIQLEQNISKMNQVELVRTLGVILNEISGRDPEMASRVLLKYLEAKAGVK